MVVKFARNVSCISVCTCGDSHSNHVRVNVTLSHTCKVTAYKIIQTDTEIDF